MGQCFAVRLAVLAQIGMCGAMLGIVVFGRDVPLSAPRQKAVHLFPPIFLQLVQYKFSCCWALGWSPAKDRNAKFSVVLQRLWAGSKPGFEVNRADFS